MGTWGLPSSPGAVGPGGSSQARALLFPLSEVGAEAAVSRGSCVGLHDPGGSRRERLLGQPPPPG